MLRPLVFSTPCDDASVSVLFSRLGFGPEVFQEFLRFVALPPALQAADLRASHVSMYGRQLAIPSKTIHDLPEPGVRMCMSVHIGAQHVELHLAPWRARAASSATDDALTVPEAVLPIDTDLGQRAY